MLGTILIIILILLLIGALPNWGYSSRMGLLSGRWARHHSDHRYYFSPDETNIATAKGKLKAQDRQFVV
jgi:hypothetical protein